LSLSFFFGFFSTIATTITITLTIRSSLSLHHQLFFWIFFCSDAAATISAAEADKSSTIAFWDLVIKACVQPAVFFIFFILVFLEGVANFPVCVRAVFVYCCIKEIVCVCAFLDDLHTCEFVTCVHAYMYVYSNSVLIGLEMCICT
jgi:hypothetical protein